MPGPPMMNSFDIIGFDNYFKGMYGQSGFPARRVGASNPIEIEPDWTIVSQLLDLLCSIYSDAFDPRPNMESMSILRGCMIPCLG